MAALSFSGCFDFEPRRFARLSAQHDRTKTIDEFNREERGRAVQNTFINMVNKRSLAQN
jgi:hypothetical protein